MSRGVHVGTVWIPDDRRYYVQAGRVPVLVLGATATEVVTTHSFGRPGRSVYPLATFRGSFRPAPDDTPTPVEWPPAAVPVDGAQFTRLGDVPIGWLFRDGWEGPGEWQVRADDDRSYEGALVECRPPDGRDVILEGGAA